MLESGGNFGGGMPGCAGMALLRAAHQLRWCRAGEGSGERYAVGQRLELRLAEADPVTGAIKFELPEGGNYMPGPPPRSKGPGNRPGGRPPIKRRGADTHYAGCVLGDERFKLGDRVLLSNASEDGQGIAHVLARIDNFWEDVQGVSWIEVTWFYFPEELHCGRLEAHGAREVFESHTSDETELASIVRKVAVLSKDEYDALPAAQRADEAQQGAERGVFRQATREPCARDARRAGVRGAPPKRVRRRVGPDGGVVGVVVRRFFRF